MRSQHTNPPTVPAFAFARSPEYALLDSWGYNHPSGLNVDSLYEVVDAQLEDETMMFQMVVELYNPGNSHNENPGMMGCRVQGAINWESPYHRRSDKYEWWVEEEFGFENERDLRKQLDKVISRMKKEMGT